MTIQKLQNKAHYLLYLVLLTPLVAYPWRFVFPFVVPKVIFMRATVVLALFVVLAIYWFENKTKNLSGKRFATPMTLVLVLFMLSLMISTLVGVDQHFSFWNNQERMMGVFTILHYLLAFFVFRYLLKKWDNWQKVLMVFCGVGIIAVSVGIIQRFFPYFFFNQLAQRVTGTFGNPIYLGSYSLFLFFISLFLFIKCQDWKRWYCAISAFFGLIGIIITGNRGTFLGLVAGLFVVWMLYLVVKKENKRFRKMSLYILACLILLGSLAFIFRETRIIRSIPVVGDVVNISLFENTATTRMMAWKIAIKAWQEKPVFGWGPNNYYFAFNKYYDPNFLRFGQQETWFDNAHNVFFNTLATQGAVGLIIYLSMFAVAICCLIVIYRKKGHIHLFVCGTALLIAHSIHNFFAFEDATSYLCLFILFALIDAYYRSDKMEEKENHQSEITIGRSWPIKVIIGLLLAGIMIFVTDVNVLAANFHGFNVRGLLLMAGQPEIALIAREKSQEWKSPHQGDLDWDFTGDVLTVLPDVFEKNKDLARRLFDVAKIRMKNYLNIHPLDARGHLVYSDLMRGGIVLFDLDLYEEAEAHLDKAEELSPQRQQIESARITYLVGVGRTDEALAKAEELIANEPGISDGYFAKAQMHHYLREYHKIPEILDRAILAGAQFQPLQALFAAENYELQGRFRDALYWYDQAAKGVDVEEYGKQIAEKRDKLSSLTKKSVPESLDEFFPYEKYQQKEVVDENENN